MATEREGPSKDELLERLRSSGRESLERLRAVPVDAFELGRYENGWNGRQILAHIASIEWTYPRLLELASQAPAAAEPPPERTGGGDKPAAEPPTRTARGGVDSYNERQVDKRAEASVDELLREFEQNRARTIAAVAAADESLLRSPVRSAGGITGPLSRVLEAVAVHHVLAHARDIVGEAAD